MNMIAHDAVNCYVLNQIQCAIARRLSSRSTSAFEWVVRVKWHSHDCHDPRFPSRTLHCNKIGISISTDFHERLGWYHQNSIYHYILTHSHLCCRVTERIRETNSSAVWLEVWLGSSWASDWGRLLYWLRLAPPPSPSSPSSQMPPYHHQLLRMYLCNVKNMVLLAGHHFFNPGWEHWGYVWLAVKTAWALILLTCWPSISGKTLLVLSVSLISTSVW